MLALPAGGAPGATRLFLIDYDEYMALPGGLSTANGSMDVGAGGSNPASRTTVGGLKGAIAAYYPRHAVLSIRRKNFYCVGCTAGAADAASWLTSGTPNAAQLTAAAAGNGEAAAAGTTEPGSYFDHHSSATLGQAPPREASSYFSMHTSVQHSRRHPRNATPVPSAQQEGGTSFGEGYWRGGPLDMYQLKNIWDASGYKVRGIQGLAM